MLLARHFGDRGIWASSSWSRISQDKPPALGAGQNGVLYADGLGLLLTGIYLCCPVGLRLAPLTTHGFKGFGPDLRRADTQTLRHASGSRIPLFTSRFKGIFSARQRFENAPTRCLQMLKEASDMFSTRSRFKNARFNTRVSIKRTRVFAHLRSAGSKPTRICAPRPRVGSSLGCLPRGGANLCRFVPVRSSQTKA